MPAAPSTRSPNSEVAKLLATGRWKIQKEEFQLPVERTELVGKINEILTGGRVQRLVVQVGEPLRAERLVPRDPNDDVPLEIPEDDYFIAARNGVIADLGSEEPLLVSLSNAFHDLAALKASPKTLMVHSEVIAKKWLGVFEREIFAVPVRHSAHIPEDVALLCGSNDPTDPFVLVTHSIRIPIVFTENSK